MQLVEKYDHYVHKKKKKVVSKDDTEKEVHFLLCVRFITAR